LFIYIAFRISSKISYFWPPFGCNSGHGQNMDLWWPELSTCSEFAVVSENTQY